MASWDDVGRIAGGLVGAESGTTFGQPVWKVGGKAFVWDRPLRRRDLDELRLAEVIEGAWAIRREGDRARRG